MARVVIGPAVPDRASLDNEIARLRGLDIGELRARWHTVFRRRAPPHLLGQLRAKPETDQQSRGIWSDINSGADLGKPTRLFVDLYIKTCL